MQLLKGQDMQAERRGEVRERWREREGGEKITENNILCGGEQKRIRLKPLKNPQLC